MEDEAEDAAAVLVEPHRLGGGKAAEGGVRGRGQQHGRHHLRDDDAHNGLRDAEVGADGEPGHPQPHRRGEQPGAHVVALAEDERRARDALGALQQREHRRHEERDGEVGAAEDRVRGRRDGDEHDAGGQAARGLDQKRLPEQTAQAPPRLSGRVVEPVLHERFLGGEVEEALEEARGDHDDGQEAEVVRAELAGREQRSEEAEADGDVDARRGCGTSEADRAEDSDSRLSGEAVKRGPV